MSPRTTSQKSVSLSVSLSISLSLSLTDSGSSRGRKLVAKSRNSVEIGEGRRKPLCGAHDAKFKRNQTNQQQQQQQQQRRGRRRKRSQGQEPSRCATLFVEPVPAKSQNETRANGSLKKGKKRDPLQKNYNPGQVVPISNGRKRKPNENSAESPKK